MAILSTLQNQKIGARNARRLPAGRINKLVVQQPIDLRPYGNTVALTVPAEMPFLARAVTVATQASGGMAKPDPYMQSHGLHGWKTRPVNGFRGLGADPGTDLDLAAYNMFQQYDADAKKMDYSDYEADANKKSYWESQVSSVAKPAATSAAPAPAASSFDWKAAGDIFGNVVTSGASAYSQITKKPLPGAVTNIINQGTAAMAPKKSNTTMYLVLGGVALLAIGGFFLLRKKSSAA